MAAEQLSEALNRRAEWSFHVRVNDEALRPMLRRFGSMRRAIWPGAAAAALDPAHAVGLRAPPHCTRRSGSAALASPAAFDPRPRRPTRGIAARSVRSWRSRAAGRRAPRLRSRTRSPASLRRTTPTGSTPPPASSAVAVCSPTPSPPRRARHRADPDRLPPARSLLDAIPLRAHARRGAGGRGAAGRSGERRRAHAQPVVGRHPPEEHAGRQLEQILIPRRGVPAQEDQEIRRGLSRCAARGPGAASRRASSGGLFDRPLPGRFTPAAVRCCVPLQNLGTAQEIRRSGEDRRGAARGPGAASRRPSSGGLFDRPLPGRSPPYAPPADLRLNYPDS